MPQEVAEQRELPGRQRDDPLAASHLASFDLQRQVGVVQDRRRRRGTSQQRAHAREQLRIRERLDQVVVGAGIETTHPVGRAATGGQHQNGQAAVRAQLPAHLQPVDAGHHQVEHHQVGPVYPGSIERRRPAEGDIDVVAFRTEDALDGGGDHRVVVHDQDPPGRRAHDPYILLALSKDAVRPFPGR